MCLSSTRDQRARTHYMELELNQAVREFTGCLLISLVSTIILPNPTSPPFTHPTCLSSPYPTSPPFTHPTCLSSPYPTSPPSTHPTCLSLLPFDLSTLCLLSIISPSYSHHTYTTFIPFIIPALSVVYVGRLVPPACPVDLTPAAPVDVEAVHHMGPHVAPTVSPKLHSTVKIIW